MGFDSEVRKRSDQAANSKSAVLQVSAKEVELLKSDQTLTECKISLIMKLNLSLVGIGSFGRNVALNSCLRL